MSDNFKKRWIFIGFTWTAAVVFTFWNLNKIDFILEMRERKEIDRMDEQFLQNNVENISQILKKQASLTKEVDSATLGLFEFENDISSLARKLGLNTFNWNNQLQSAQNGAASVKISFQSSFKQAMMWFDLLKTDLPYAQIKNVKIETEPSLKQTKFEVFLSYRYRLSS